MRAAVFTCRYRTPSVVLIAVACCLPIFGCRHSTGVGATSGGPPEVAARGGPDVEPILVRLESAQESDWEPALNEVRNLGRAAVAPLVEGLKSANTTRRCACLMALGGLGRDAIEARDAMAALLDAEPDVSSKAALALAHTGDARGLAILGQLLASEDERTLIGALDAVTQLGHAAGPVRAQVTDLLASPSVDVRRWAACALGAIGDGDATGDLEPLLADPSSRVRAQAAEALVALGDDDAQVRAVLQATATDPSEHVQTVSASARARLGDSSAVGDLRRLLGSDSWEVREAAAGGLIPLWGDAAGATDELVRCLDDPQRDVRRASARTLSAIASPELRDRLEAPLSACGDDGDPYLSLWAASALAKCGVRSLSGPLLDLVDDVDPEIQGYALAGLRYCGVADESARERLRPLLTGDDEHLRWLAAMALAHMGDTSVAPLLREAIARPEDDIRLRAAEALLALGEPGADTVLTELKGSTDRRVRDEATRILGQWRIPASAD